MKGWPLKGVAQHTIWLVFGIILLVLTAALFYAIFPHSDCDRMAQVSAQEIKNAVECAAKYSDGVDPATGKSCDTANIRLCQENSFSAYGMGPVQEYMGLMVPEYMIYYQKFPAEPHASTISIGAEGSKLSIPWTFDDTYPFGRAYTGQRPWDWRPTLTQFKEFFKTNYLKKGCTSDQGLCVNVRGREDVLRVSGNVPDVRLKRDGVGLAEDNPKFYVVAPCNAKVVFQKKSDDKIYGTVMKEDTPNAANYCYLDSYSIMSLISAYGAEVSCEAALVAMDVMSFGTESGVEEGAQLSAKEGAVIAVKVALRSFGRMSGISVSSSGTLGSIFGVLPCVDADPCRGAGACAEANLWPGYPWGELTDRKMKDGKISDTVADVFAECCVDYNYGAEKDPAKINCTSPSDLVDLIKPDLKVNKTDNITLAKAATYLGVDLSKIKSVCALELGDNSKDCRDSMEMQKLHMVDNCIADVSEHTYDFGIVKRTSKVTVMVKLHQPDCGANVEIDLSNDTQTWVKANTTKALPNVNNFVYIFRRSSFQYLSVREDGQCYLENTRVVLDPVADIVTAAAPDVPYKLNNGNYNYFILPQGYSGKASTLCNAVKYCSTMALWDADLGQWSKWSNEGGSAEGNDFDMNGGDKVGILVTQNSEVTFKVS